MCVCGSGSGKIGRWSDVWAARVIDWHDHASRAERRNHFTGFLVRHLVKDIRLAQEEADLHGLRLPGLEVARKLYELVEKLGYGEAGTQVLFHHYETNIGVG
mgnify:CR=1 FL=1